jgi:hypothetical protein
MSLKETMAFKGKLLPFAVLRWKERQRFEEKMSRAVGRGTDDIQGE